MAGNDEYVLNTPPYPWMKVRLLGAARNTLLNGHKESWFKNIRWTSFKNVGQIRWNLYCYRLYFAITTGPHVYVL